MASQAHIIFATDVIAGIGSDLAPLRVANLAVGTAADWVWDFLGWSVGIGSRWNRRRKDFCQAQRVQTCIAPFLAVAGAVGAEGRIVSSAGVVGIVALLARHVEGGAMLREPGCRAMRLGLFGLDHRDDWSRSPRGTDLGQGVANIAFEANRVFVVRREMLAVVAAEAAR